MEDAKQYAKKGTLLIVVSALIAVVSFAKEAVFASYFGTSAEADAYTIAIQAPEILFAVVWEAINSIVIPLYSKKYFEDDCRESSRFISGFITLFVVGACALLVAGELLADQIIFIFAPGLHGETHVLAVSLIRSLLPMLVFEGVCRICSGVLNVHGYFASVRAISCIRNIGIVAFLVLFASDFGVFAAVYGILVGLFIECIISVVFVSRREAIRPCFNFRDPTFRTAGKMALPVALGVGIAEINQMVDKIVASFLSSGSIASLNYSSKLSSIIGSIIFGSVVTLVFPAFARLASTKDDELTAIYIGSIKTMLLLCIPVVFGGIAMGETVVQFAFQRGEFDGAATELVSVLFMGYLVVVAVGNMRAIPVKLFLSLCDTKTPMINSAIGAAINIVLNIVLAYLLGVIGLVVASVVSECVIAALLFLKAKKRVPNIKYGSIAPTAGLSALAAAGMCAVVLPLKFLLGVYMGLGAVVVLLVAVIFGIAAYGFILYLLKVPEIMPAIDHIKRIVRKGRKEEVE